MKENRAMSRIPQVRMYRITFYYKDKVIAADTVMAPTKHLAWLNLIFEKPEFLKFKAQADRITTGVTRKSLAYQIAILPKE
jgi:hypothetical protein